MYYSHVDSPIGDLLVAGDGEAICMIGFPEGPMRRAPDPGWVQSDELFGETRRQLAAYFGGTLHEFALPLRPTGTAFQLAVLEELRKIPYGTTASYAEIARRVGRPKAVRAVGAANRRNPIPIVIPCHRVIGSNGDLTGFGGGLDTKKALLRLEMENSAAYELTPA